MEQYRALHKRNDMQKAKRLTKRVIVLMLDAYARNACTHAACNNAVGQNCVYYTSELTLLIHILSMSYCGTVHQREGNRVESRLWQCINWLKVQNIRLEPKQTNAVSLICYRKLSKQN